MIRNRDPFRVLRDVDKAAEALEDAIDKIREEFSVDVFVSNDCCGCTNVALTVGRDDEEATLEVIPPKPVQPVMIIMPDPKCAIPRSPCLRCSHFDCAWCPECSPGVPDL